MKKTLTITVDLLQAVQENPSQDLARHILSILNDAANADAIGEYDLRFGGDEEEPLGSPYLWSSVWVRNHD